MDSNTKEVTLIQKAMHDPRLDEGDWMVIAFILDAGGILRIYGDSNDYDAEKAIINRLEVHGYIHVANTEFGLICEVIR